MKIIIIIALTGSLLESDDGPHGPVDEDLSHEIKITDENGTIGSSGQSYGRKKSLLRGLPVAIVTVQRPLMPVSHSGQDNPWFLLQIDIRTVPFLQYTLVEVVSMMNVQVPSANLGYGHIVTAELGRLHVPDDVLAVVVLVSDLHHCRGHTVHALPVDVQSVPSVREFYHRIRLERLLEQDTLDRDSQMDQVQGGRYRFRRQLQLYRGQIAGRSGAVVNEIQPRAGYLQAFLYDLGLGQNRALVRAGALETVLPRSKHHRLHQVVIVSSAGVRHVAGLLFLRGAHHDFVDDYNLRERY